jgi:hypothetical protein
MPYLDGTGPDGLGSPTGRGLGECEEAQESYKNRELKESEAPFVTEEEDKTIKEEEIKIQIHNLDSNKKTI